MSEGKGIRAIRGATTVDFDDADQIIEATRELVAAIVERNGLTSEDVVSALFTMTPDLRSEFPARAARELGWDDVPMLCTIEIDVRGALPRCIRALVHASSDRARSDVRHVYLRGAHVLRPDLVDGAGRQAREGQNAQGR
jgi:chorismate mutase